MSFNAVLSIERDPTRRQLVSDFDDQLAELLLVGLSLLEFGDQPIDLGRCGKLPLLFGDHGVARRFAPAFRVGCLNGYARAVNALGVQRVFC